MTKKIAAFVCGATLAFSAVCSATVAPEKIGIAGVNPGMSESALVAAVGQPNSKSPKGDDWYYNGFTVEFDKDRPGVVEEITTRNAGISTAAGISVGQNVSVLNALGQADKTDPDNDETEYTRYSNDYSKKLEVDVVNGVIVKISCKLR